MEKFIKENELQILSSTGMTESDAKKHLKDGAIIYDLDDYLNNFEEYTSPFDFEQEEKEEFKKFLETRKIGSYRDNDLTKYDGKYFFIEYVL